MKAHLGNTGYTIAMKTAISVPDDIFAEAEALASRMGLNRSQLFTLAVRELIERQGDDPVTQQLDVLADELAAQGSPNVGRTLIESGAWEW